MLPSAEHGSLLIQGLQYAMSYRAIYHFKLTHLHMRSATRELRSDRGSQFYTATNPGKQCLKPSCPTKSSVCFSLRVLTSLAQRVNISLLISIVHDSKKKKAEIQYDISKHSCPLSPLMSQGFPPDHRGFGCHGHAHRHDTRPCWISTMRRRLNCSLANWQLLWWPWQDDLNLLTNSNGHK